MYKYEYVEVEQTGVIGLSMSEHRDIIDEYAINGWRFVAAIPTRQVSGFINKLDLVFEKACD